MKNNILNEVHRIKEVMGVKPKLLTEISKLVSSFADYLDDFFKTVQVKPIKNTTDVMVGNVKTSQRSYDNIIRALNDPTGELLTTLDNTTLQALGRIIRQNENLVNLLYKSVIKDFLELTPGATEESLIKLIKDKVDSGEKLIEILGEMTDDDYAVVNAIFLKISKKIEDLETGKFTPEVSRTLKSGEGVRSLTADEVSKFNKVIERKTPKTFIGDVITLWRNSLDEIKDRIIELSRGFEQDIVDKTPEEVARLLNAYAVAISRNLDLVEIKLNGAAAEILEKEGLPKEIVNKLKTDKSAFLDTFRIARAADNQSFVSLVTQTTIDFALEILEFVRGVFRLGLDNSFLKLFKPSTSIGQYFLTDNWATWNKLWKLAIKTSAGQNKSKFIIQAMFASSVGAVVGSLITDIMGGLSEATIQPHINNLLDYIGGEDKKWLGQDIEKWKFELSNSADVEANIITKILNPIVSRIIEGMLSEFKERGLFPALLNAIPGGLTTFQNSMAAQLASGLVYGPDYIPNLREGIYNAFGTTTKEVEKNVEEVKQEVENQEQLPPPPTEVTQEVPQDLKNLVGDKSGQIKVKDDGTYYWGSEEFVVEKINGQWNVYFPPNPDMEEVGGWYLVTDMKL